MIINGGSRSNWRFFAKHLLKAEENEQVRVTEFRGVAAETVLEALREMNALASGTRCTNFFYHANLNPRAEEVLTPEQWDEAVDALEHQLGLDGHSRFIVEHEKEGRCHRHVIWSRIDTDTMTATSDSRNYAAHERTSRALEEAFGHEPVVGAHGHDGQRPDRRPKNWETFRGHVSGVDPAELAREVTDLWRQADSGKAFAAALAANGYRLCRGDRRDFCLVDAVGDVHSLARRIDGARAADIRAGLSDLDSASLPSVIEVRAELVATNRATADVEAPVELSPTPEPSIRGDTIALNAATNAEAQQSTKPQSALDAFAQQVKAVMRANDGNPHFNDGLGWWERTANVVQSTYQHAADWVKGRWQDLVEQWRPGQPRDRDNDGPDFER